MKKRSSQSLTPGPRNPGCLGPDLPPRGFRMRWLKVSGGILAVALAACGCSMLSYTGPSGEHFARCTLGTRTAIAALNVETGTNGIRRIELQGYQNDSTQALGTVTEAIVRAALQAR